MRHKSQKQEEVLDEALNWGKSHYPEAPSHKHCAFANSVALLVTGWSGGFGGPSMREHYAARVALSHGTNGTFSFEKAVKIVTDPCYGPLTLNHARMLAEEACFDDDPQEVWQAEGLLQSNYRRN